MILEAAIMALLNLPPETKDVVSDTFEQYKCLTDNIYFESRGEPVRGQVLVGLVTLERTDSNRYPNDICSVVYAKKAFSWTESPPDITDFKSYVASASNALRAVEAFSTSESLGITHYHSTSVNPYWAKSMDLVLTYGHHKFYSEENN